MNTTTKNGVEFKACGCGCGAAIGSKSNYKPGHDARHAGQVARTVADRVLANEFDSVHAAGFAFEVLPSQALREKAFRMAEKIVVKANTVVTPKDRTASRQESVAAAKRAKTERVNDEVNGKGSIKIGRWTYPARMTGVGKVERNEKRDGSGQWLPVSPNAAQNIDWE